MGKQNKLPPTIRNFRQRLKTIGSVYHHDFHWKKAFVESGFEWKDWWDEYCDGYHNLVGSFHDDERRKEGTLGFCSIFTPEGENLFIRWLYGGQKKYLKPFYEWFVDEMNKRKREAEKEEKLMKRKLLPQTTPGYVYLIKSGDYYKIGKAKHLSNRVKAHQTSSPNKIELVLNKRVEDYSAVETKLLEMFTTKRVRGEWFRLSREDIGEISLYLTQQHHEARSG